MCQNTVDEGKDLKACLSFLQTQVSKVVEHSKAEESQAFRTLSTYLFNPAKEEFDSIGLLAKAAKGASLKELGRQSLYEQLLCYLSVSL